MYSFIYHSVVRLVLVHLDCKKNMYFIVQTWMIETALVHKFTLKK